MGMIVKKNKLFFLLIPVWVLERKREGWCLFIHFGVNQVRTLRFLCIISLPLVQLFSSVPHSDLSTLLTSTPGLRWLIVATQLRRYHFILWIKRRPAAERKRRRQGRKKFSLSLSLPIFSYHQPQSSRWSEMTKNRKNSMRIVRPKLLLLQSEDDEKKKKGRGVNVFSSDIVSLPHPSVSCPLSIQCHSS